MLIGFQAHYHPCTISGDSGVFRFDAEYGLSDETTVVSDHYPIYAEYWIGKDTD